MIDWSLSADLQTKYNDILERNRKLQLELGIVPRTLEQRAQDYEKKKLEREQAAQELARLKALTANRRPPPRWKV